MGNDIVELALPEESRRSLLVVYLRVVFVPVLVFLVFLAGYLGYINLKVQIHSVFMLGILLFMALILARHNAEYGCCVFERKTGAFKTALKDYIMSHLIVVGNRKKSNAPFESFAENFTKNIRNDNYASVATGVFPMLGILGTFISIAIAMPEFSSTNINALESEIAQLLGGVGTAFYVSIYGIFLALWWMFFEKKGLTRFQKIMFKYKNATRNFFWEESEISQGLMQEILNRNEKVANTFETIFDVNFNEKLRNSMLKNYELFNDMVDMQKSIINATSQKLKNTRILLEEIEENSQNLNIRYEKTISDIDRLLADTNLAYSNLTGQIDKFLSNNEKNNIKFIGSVERLVNEMKNFENIVEKANIKSNFLDKNLEKESEDDFNINDNTNEIKKILLDMKEKYANNNDILSELKKSLSDIDRNSKK